MVCDVICRFLLFSCYLELTRSTIIWRKQLEKMKPKSSKSPKRWMVLKTAWHAWKNTQYKSLTCLPTYKNPSPPLQRSEMKPYLGVTRGRLNHVIKINLQPGAARAALQDCSAGWWVCQLTYTDSKQEQTLVLAAYRCTSGTNFLTATHSQHGTVRCLKGAVFRKLFGNSEEVTRYLHLMNLLRPPTMGQRKPVK